MAENSPAEDDEKMHGSPQQIADADAEGDKVTDEFKKLHIGERFTIKENWKNCLHLLSDASYADIKDLCLLLDTAKPLDARKGIINLMRKIMKEEHVVQVWLACHGGLSPAMGFIQYLSSTWCTTIAEFKKYLPEKSAAYQILNDRAIKEKYAGNTVLDEIAYEILEKLASSLSEKMHLKNKNLQFTWKDVAGNAGIDRNIIKALNSPHHQAVEENSMTEQMVDLLGGLEPDFKIANLQYGLFKIDRNDITKNGKIFKSCNEARCLDRCLTKVAVEDQ